MDFWQRLSSLFVLDSGEIQNKYLNRNMQEED
jgi:hypothetical protein